jgi:conjugal transfer/type IV secretion protein DotA/TraY
MINDLGIRRGPALRYLFLPQILPRVGNLLTSGFIHLPYFIIVVLNTVGIIPNNHPYLRRDHRGTYSIFQALAIGANHIPFNVKNIDKITIFGTLLVGMALLVLQFLLCIVALFTGPAFAYQGPGLGPRTAAAFIDNPNASTDIAFRILDLVFGIPNIYNSANMQTTAFHRGLHALFEFYSFGILLVGALVIIYLVTAIVMETAQSGVPFGQRFNKAWAPIRLILFFGLLLPATHGINLAQYFVLESARLGSNVATNAWLAFDTAAQTPYLGTPEQMIATPNTPDLKSLATFMAIARTCSWAEGRVNGVDVRPYLVFEAGQAGGVDISGSAPAFPITARRAHGGTLLIRFGEQSAQKYPNEPGAVSPDCGELTMPIVDQSQPGSAIIQQAYIEMIPCMWSGAAGSEIACQQEIFTNQGRDYTARFNNSIRPVNPYPDMRPYVGSSQRTSILTLLNEDFRAAVQQAIERQISQGEWNNDPARVLGWAGAAIWFNRIAEQNGAITSAVHAKPEIKQLPYVMEYIKKEKLRQDRNTPLLQLYTPSLSTGGNIRFETPQQREVALILNQVFKSWGDENQIAFYKEIPESQNQGATGNVIIDVVNGMMGTQGLFDMCKNTNIHPLAQLSALGRGLVEHSIRSFGMAAGIGLGAGILGILEKSNFAASLSGATSFFITFGTIGLMLGFILFYVLPFLPFIYFFFAVMTWVKSIFEAMVAMPLWALAHLKIDGEGMPGDAAASGYFYILEIFLRPICIILGFLGGIIIFSAMVKVLNEVFYLVLSNLSGHHVAQGSTSCFQPPAAAGGAPATGGPTEAEFKRGPIDEFFYTVVYTVIVYLIALPCFKLVDLIPDNIMRWMGAGIQSFGSQDGDPAEGLMTNVAGGAGLVGSSLQNSLRK